MNFLDSFQWCGRGAEYANRVRAQRVEELSHFTSKTGRTAGITVCHHHSGQSGEGRVKHRLAISGFSCVKVFEALSDGELERVVIREVALNHDLAALIAAAGPAGYLSQQLKGSLGCAEIGQRQRGVRAKDSN